MGNLVREPRKNKFGPVRVLLRRDGKYIVYDSRLAPGERTIFLCEAFDAAREHAVAMTGITRGEDSEKGDE